MLKFSIIGRAVFVLFKICCSIVTAKAILSPLGQLPKSDSAEYRQLSVTMEQLDLLQKNKHGRHQSPQCSFLIHAPHSSLAAYSILVDENILHLPSVNTLKKLMHSMSAST